METDAKEATVTIQDKDMIVTFKGLWTRSLIDSAHRSMLRALPKHVSEWKRFMRKCDTLKTEEESE